MWFLITICGVFGAICGTIIGFLTSLTVGIVVGIATAVLAFAGFVVYGIISYNRPTPENAVERLTDWLSSPMEYGSPPDSCEVVFHEELPWPMDGELEHVILCRFRYESDDENEEAIGLAWPTCWTFFGLEVELFTIEELISCYRGWYIVLNGMHDNSLNTDSLTDDECEQLSGLLIDSGFEVEAPFTGSRSQIVRTTTGEQLFAVEVKKNGEPIVAVGNLADPKSIETREAGKYSYAVGHYHWVGTWWQNKSGVMSNIKQA